MENDPELDDVTEAAFISEARQFAARAVLMLEHPKLNGGDGQAEHYGKAYDTAKLVLHLVQQSEVCSDAEEFDDLLYLICCHADCLARSISRLRIP